VAGCSAKITRNSLDEAPEMRRRVEQYQAEEKTRGKAAASQVQADVTQL